jgi:hypothetical protein
MSLRTMLMCSPLEELDKYDRTIGDGREGEIVLEFVKSPGCRLNSRIVLTEVTLLDQGVAPAHCFCRHGEATGLTFEPLKWR